MLMVLVVHSYEIYEVDNTVTELKCVAMSSLEDTVISSLRCEALGVNKQGCQLLTRNEKCIWVEEKESCISIGNLEAKEQTRILLEAKCSDYVNKYACLAILNPDEPCYWDVANNTCAKIVNPDLECKAWSLSDVQRVPEESNGCEEEEGEEEEEEKGKSDVLVSPSACSSVKYQKTTYRD